EPSELPGRETRPAQEGAREVAGIRVADRPGDVADLPGRVLQHAPRHVSARLSDHARVSQADVAQPALERPGTHPEHTRDELDVRMARGAQHRDDPPHVSDGVAPGAQTSRRCSTWHDPPSDRRLRLSHPPSGVLPFGATEGRHQSIRAWHEMARGELAEPIGSTPAHRASTEVVERSPEYWPHRTGR